MTVRLVQVTNVSTSVTKDQLKSLFTHLGRIDEIQLYPESETLLASVGAKVGYIRFDRSELAQAALNLSTTVFLDRPIICSLVKYGGSSSSSANYRIPDETEALAFCAPLSSNISLIPGGATWPHSVINRLVTVPASSLTGTLATTYIETIDSALSDRSLPQYPHLPGTMDQAKAEEIRRTVYVSNIDPRVSFENLFDLFSQVGEIRYMRMTKSENDVEYENLGLSNKTQLPDDAAHVDIDDDSVSAFIEFSEQPSIAKALCLNGLSFAKRRIKVNHAMSSVIIPPTEKLHVSLETLKKESAKSKKHSSSHHHHHHHRSDRHSSKHNNHRSSKHSGSAMSSEDSEEESDDENKNNDDDDEEQSQEESENDSDSSSSSASSTSSSPPTKKHHSSRSDSKNKSSVSKSSKHSSKSPKSSSSKHHSSSSKRSKSRERDRDRDRDRDRGDRDRDRDRNRDKYRDRDKHEKEKKSSSDKHHSSSSSSSSKKRDSDHKSSSSRSSTHQSSSSSSSKDPSKSSSGRNGSSNISSSSSSSHKRSHSSKKRSSSRSSR